jgi:hypothetical protein
LSGHRGHITTIDFGGRTSSSWLDLQDGVKPVFSFSKWLSVSVASTKSQIELSWKLGLSEQPLGLYLVQESRRITNKTRRKA